MKLTELSNLYKKELFENVIPFWQNNSEDKEYGGYYSCLDREGKVYDTDKFIWLQARQVWTFAMLYNRVEQRKEWLDLALRGAAFLMKYGRDEQGDWYFSLNGKGEPLIQPYNIFSDCFAAMAFGQLYNATGDPQYAELAEDTFKNILQRQDNPKGKYSKAYPGTRELKDFALPMILSNLVLEIEHILDPELVDKTIKKGIDDVIHKFYRPELKVTVENIKKDGSLSDSFEGRLVNPGHGLESMWFIMDLAAKQGDQDLMKKTVEISLNLMDFGWDEKYEGLFYFKDRLNKPVLQLEWDQKLWWVHIEAMIAMLKGYLHTGNKKCMTWFEKLHRYTWEKFRDPEYGEWWGYLNRRGEVLIPSKGGKWKGCFHVPRGLFQIWKTLEKIKNQQSVLS